MQVSVGYQRLPCQFRVPAQQSKRHSCQFTHSRRQIIVAGLPGEAKVDVSQAKADIVKLAGEKYGLDKYGNSLPGTLFDSNPLSGKIFACFS
jgi:hypothetical protein